MLKKLTNEAALHRGYVLKSGGNDPETEVFLDPIERMARVLEAVEDEEGRQESTDQFYGELGWT